MSKEIYFDSKNYVIDTNRSDASFYEQYKNGQLIDTTLNSVQEDILLFNKINPSNTVYFVSFKIILKEQIDEKLLVDRIREGICREKLNIVGIEAYLKNHYFVFGNTDDRIKSFCQLGNDFRGEEKLIEDLYSEAMRTLKSRGAFFEVIIVRLKNGRQIILSVFSHLIFSGNSINRFTNYIVEGEKTNSSELYEIQDYKVKDIELQISKIYSEKYSSVSMKSGKRIKSFEVNHKILFFRNEANRIYTYIKENKLDAFTFFSAIYGILISRFSGETDFLVCFPVEMKGHTIFSTKLNMMLLPMSISDYCFERIALDIKRKRFFLLTLKNKSTKRIVEILKNHQMVTDDYMTTVAMSFQKVEQSENFTIEPIVEKEMEYSISLEIIEQDEQYTIIIKSQKMAMANYTFELFSRLFRELVNLILNNEKINFNYSNEILNFKNVPTKPLYIHDMFQSIVKETPNHVALRYNEKDVTYLKLDRISNRIGNLLIKNNVKTNDIIIVCLQDSPIQMGILLAIWKIGAVYLPLDYSCPKKRIETVIETVHPKLIILEKDFGYDCDMLLLNDIESRYLLFFDKLKYRYCQRSYIIFTSGTSGTPKGVVNTHQGVCELINYFVDIYKFSKDDTGVLLHSLAFDFSIWEILISLLTGGTLCIVDNEIKFDLVKVYNIICKENITIANFTPSAFVQFNTVVKNIYDYMHNDLRIVFLGAESLSYNILEDWMRAYPECKMVNLYGPSETSIISTQYLIDPKEILVEKDNCYSCIGYPIASSHIIILNKKNELAYPGCMGEICIGGHCVGMGYLNDTELTNKHFCTIALDYVVYRTNDLGYIDENGKIYYCGRDGSFVKIRGYRVDLNEIAHTIRLLPEVLDVVVRIIEERIIAFVLLNNDSTDNNENEIINELGELLPYYMIPSKVVLVEEMPKTTSDKVDGKKLDDIYFNYIDDLIYDEPQTPTEKFVYDIVISVLKIERLSMQDDFFALGGDSLKVVELVSLIGMDLSVSDIYKNSTLMDLCKIIDKYRIIKKECYKENSVSINKNELERASFVQSLIMASGVSISFYNSMIVFNGSTVREGGCQNQISVLVTEALDESVDIKISCKVSSEELKQYLLNVLGIYEEGMDFFVGKEINGIRISALLLNKLPQYFLALFPLNSMQKAMILDSISSSEEDMYSCLTPFAFSCKDFNEEKYRRAIEQIVYDNDVFRTVYVNVLLGQVVSENSNLQYSYVDLLEYPIEQRKTIIENDAMACLIKIEDVKKGVLFRVKLYRYGEYDYQLIVLFNHSIIDGYSMSLFISQLNHYYALLIRGEVVKSNRKIESFAKMVLSEKKIIGDLAFCDYWRHEIDESTYHSFLKDQKGAFKTEQYIFQHNVGFEAFASSHGVSPALLYYACILFILNDRFKNDAAIGIVQNNRDLCLDPFIMGNFINTTVLRVRYNNQTFEQYINLVKDRFSELQIYKNMPLMEIEKIRKNLNHLEPLYDICVNYTDFVEQYNGEDSIKVQSSIVDAKGKISVKMNLNITRYKEYTCITYETNVGEEEKTIALEIYNRFIEMINMLVETGESFLYNINR